MAVRNSTGRKAKPTAPVGPATAEHPQHDRPDPPGPVQGSPPAMNCAPQRYVGNEANILPRFPGRPACRVASADLMSASARKGNRECCQSEQRKRAWLGDTRGTIVERVVT